MPETILVKRVLELPVANFRADHRFGGDNFVDVWRNVMTIAVMELPILGGSTQSDTCIN